MDIHRLILRPWVFAILWTAMHTVGPARAEDPAGRVQELVPGQWQAWIKTAEDLVRRGTLKDLDAARHLYEACFRASDDARSRVAVERLVSLHLHPRALFRSRRAALGLLMYLARKTGEESFLERIDSVRMDILPEKRREVDWGDKALGAGKLRKAEGHYRAALLLPFSLPVEVGEGVDDRELIRRLVSLSLRLEKAHRDRFEGKDPKCPVCGGRSARVCPRCKGEKRIKQVQPALPDMPRTPYYVKCPKCKGYGMIMCEACQCSGFRLNLLEPLQAKALGEYSKAVVSLLAKKRLEDALEKAQDYVLGLPMSVPDTFLPDDADVAYLFPFNERTEVPSKFKTLWTSRKKAIDKINLLVDFGVYVTRTLRPYKIHGTLPRTGRVSRNFAEAVPVTVPLPPDRLGVHPDFYHDRWESVRGVFTGKKEIPGFRVITFFTLKGAGENGLIFAAWNPPARIGAKKIGRLSASLRSLTRFGYAYPFDSMSTFLAGLEAGTEVEVFGRLLFRDGGWPRKIFEVWWGGAPGTAPGTGGEEAAFPAVPTPGNPLADSEAWVLSKSNADRLLGEGHGNFRRALRACSEADGAEEGFGAHNERAVALLEKARAYYEKAWSRKKEPAVARLIDRVNKQIRVRAEAARAR